MDESKRNATGLSSLLQAGDDDRFSVIETVGGVRGVIESMLPGVVFVVMFVLTTDVHTTVIVSAVLAGVQILVRLMQRQSITGALGGLISLGICLLWAWHSNQARDYYLFGFITNAAYIALLIGSLLARVPGLGALIEFIRTLPTAGFGDWLHGWLDDRELRRAYTAITLLWIGVFALRLAVQLPLYLTNHVTALGTTRLLMGIPFLALAIWISYLIVATPMHRHNARVRASTQQTDDDTSCPAQ